MTRSPIHVQLKFKGQSVRKSGKKRKDRETDRTCTTDDTDCSIFPADVVGKNSKVTYDTVTVVRVIRPEVQTPYTSGRLHNEYYENYNPERCRTEVETRNVGTRPKVTRPFLCC